MKYPERGEWVKLEGLDDEITAVVGNSMCYSHDVPCLFHSARHPDHVTHDLCRHGRECSPPGEELIYISRSIIPEWSAARLTSPP